MAFPRVADLLDVTSITTRFAVITSVMGGGSSKHPIPVSFLLADSIMLVLLAGSTRMHAYIDCA
jgi:hypothetical protein